MPKLKCNVDRCRHNLNQSCAKNKIYVGGLFASNKAETECISFEEKRSDFYKDYEEYASLEGECCDTQIVCSCGKCIYNENSVCKADLVNVEGIHAREKDQTSCATFKK